MKCFIALLTTISLFTVFFAGCAQKPSEPDAETAVKELIQKQSGGLIQLVSYQKVNGVSGEKDGVKTYRVEYTATITFTDECWWGNAFGQYQAKRPGGNGPYGDQLNYRKHSQKGEQEQISSADIEFEKTENGWKPTNGRRR